MPEKIFVIGSNSFTAATFVAHALEAGCEVYGCSRSPELDPVFLPYRWGSKESFDRFRFDQLDLNDDLEKIVEAISAFQPDFIVNFAAQGMVAESWNDPEQWFRTNLLAPVRLTERIRGFDFIRKFVQVSTPEIYGACVDRVREDAPFNPSTPYAASKAACDMHLKTFVQRYGFPAVFTRAANLYGPGQLLYRIIPRTILYIRTGRKLQLHGGGRAVRAFIHGRDVADATLRIARNAQPGEAFHLAPERFVSIRELVELICRKMGADFNEVVEIADDRPGKDAAYILDSSKAREELGWNPAIDLETGIDETIAWIDRHLETLKQQPSDYIHKP